MAETETIASSTFAVQRGDWIGLTPEMAALVAPPVTVSTMPFDRPVSGPVGAWRKGQLARSRGNMPVTRHRRPTR
jgi:hypothetical protein